MNIFNIIILFLIVFLPFIGLSQKDNPINDSIDYAVNLMKTDIVKAEKILEKYVNVNSPIPDTTKIKALYHLAFINYTLEKFDKAVTLITKAIVLSKNNKFYYLEALLHFKSSIFIALGSSDESIKTSKEILSLNPTGDNKLSVYVNIIIAFIRKKEDDSVFYYAKLATNQYKKHSPPSKRAQLLYLDGILFNTQFYVKKNYDSSLILLKHGIADSILPNTTYFNLQFANTYIELNKYDSALKYVEIAKNIASKNKDTTGIIDALDFNIKIFDSLGNLEMKQKATVERYSYNAFSKKVTPETYANFFEESKGLAKKQSKAKYIAIGIIILIVFGLLLYFLFKNKAKNKEDDFSKYLTPGLQQKIDFVLSKMEKNKEYLNPDFSMTYLQDKININRKYISIYFKEIKKESFVLYTNRLRIEFLKSEINKKNNLFEGKSIKKTYTILGYKTTDTFKKHLSKYSNLNLEYLKSLISRNK